MRRLFQQYLNLAGHYNKDFAGGKWAHFMDQPVLGYTSWRDPPKNNLDHLKLAEPAVPAAAALGVAVEGGDTSLPQFRRLQPPAGISSTCSTAAKARSNSPPRRTNLDPTQRGRRLAQRGSAPVGEHDWSQGSSGKSTGTVKISAAGAEVLVKAEAINPTGITRDTLEGFVEANGHVSIEPEHFTRATEAGANRWFKVSDYGRTLSGMKAWGPVDAPSATPGKDSPCLEYRMYLFTTGEAEVTAITAPTLNFVPDRGVRYAVSFDDEPAQIVTLVPQGYQAQNRNAAWEKSVGDNAHFGRSKHRILAPGYHTLNVWMVDPAVLMQKLIVDLGGLKPSYLGPPESYHSNKAP